MTILQHIENQVLSMDPSRSCRDEIVLHKIKNLAQIMGLIHHLKKAVRN